jgi:hypothetical protein
MTISSKKLGEMLGIEPRKPVQYSEQFNSKIEELIKALEAESGIPVQLTIYPRGYERARNESTYGDLHQRQLTVRREDNLDPKYASVAGLEGQYDSLKQLNEILNGLKLKGEIPTTVLASSDGIYDLSPDVKKDYKSVVNPPLKIADITLKLIE